MHGRPHENQRDAIFNLPLDNHRFLIKVSVDNNVKEREKRKGELDDDVKSVQPMKIRAQLRKVRPNFMANITSH